jgi:NADPH2:quinone reductase
MVSFGNASGPVTGVNLGILAQKGSLFVTRPTLMHHITPRAKLEAAADELFDLMTRGKIKVEIDQRYRLADAAQAHRDLASRKTTGSSVLIP